MCSRKGTASLPGLFISCAANLISGTPLAPPQLLVEERVKLMLIFQRFSPPTPVLRKRFPMAITVEGDGGWERCGRRWTRLTWMGSELPPLFAELRISEVGVCLRNSTLGVGLLSRDNSWCLCYSIKVVYQSAWAFYTQQYVSSSILFTPQIFVLNSQRKFEYISSQKTRRQTIKERFIT